MNGYDKSSHSSGLELDKRQDLAPGQGQQQIKAVPAEREVKRFMLILEETLKRKANSVRIRADKSGHREGFNLTMGC